MPQTHRSLVAALAATLFASGSALAQTRAALVSDLDNPARNPVVLRFLAAGNGGSVIYYDTGYVVPAGKRLVVETVSIVSRFNSIRPVSGFKLLDGAGAGGCGPLSGAAGSPLLMVPLAFQGAAFGNAAYAAVVNVRTYVDPGRCLAAWIGNDTVATEAVQYEVSLSGHLFSLP